jgi:hypothetical protein
MKAIAHRIRRVEEHVAASVPQPAVRPATVRWLGILGIFLRHIDKIPVPPDARDAVRVRLESSIAFLEAYNADPAFGSGGANLEYYCQNCIYMLSWATPEDPDRNTLAFLEPDYDERMERHMRRVEWERNPPQPRVLDSGSMGDSCRLTEVIEICQ